MLAGIFGSSREEGVFEFEGYQMACHGTILDIWYTLTIELDRQETGERNNKKKREKEQD
jgi:hypothetical protein